MFVTRKQHKKKQNDVLIRELTKVTDDNSNDNAVDSQSRCKNLRNKHLRKEFSVLGITQRATRPTNTNGQATMTLKWKNLPTGDIRQTHTKTCAEDCIASKIHWGNVIIRTQVTIDVTTGRHFVDKDHSNDDPIDSVCLAENNTILKTRSKRYLIRFFDRILGAFTQPPIRVEAAVQIPLKVTNRKKTLPSSSNHRQS